MVLSRQVVQGGPATAALLPQGGSGLNKRELRSMRSFRGLSRSQKKGWSSLTLAAGTCSRWTHTCLKVCSGDRVSMPVTNGLENRVSPVSANPWGLKSSTWSWKIPQGVSSDCPRMSIGPLTLTAPSIPTLPCLIHTCPHSSSTKSPPSSGLPWQTQPKRGHLVNTQQLLIQARSLQRQHLSAVLKWEEELTVQAPEKTLRLAGDWE